MRLPLALARLLLTAATLPLAFASQAFAGGFGIVGNGGLHGDRIYGYSENDAGELKQDAPELQMNGNYGVGAELMLGDRDNRITGVFRLMYLGDAPQSPPEVGEVYAIRTKTRDTGVFNAGIQWGLVGDPTRIQLTALSYIGAGFMTRDFVEFATADAGIGGTWNPSRNLQVFVEATGGIRYRKRVTPTVSGALGVRYLFD